MRYQNNYRNLTEEVIAIVKSSKSQTSTYANNQRMLLEQLIEKRKQLKKVTDELQVVKEMFGTVKQQSKERRLMQEEAMRYQKKETASKDEQEEGTEDGSKYAAGNEMNEDEGPEEEDELMDPHKRFEGADEDEEEELKNDMLLNSLLEKSIVRLLARCSNCLLKQAQSVEQSLKLIPSVTSPLHDVFAVDEVSPLTLECEKLVVSIQSSISFGEFILHDPHAIFQNFGREPIIVRTWLTI